MDFDQERVGAHRHGAFAHGENQVAPASALAGIDHDWAMGFFFDDRDGGKIKRVARVGFESANAALAEYQIRIFVGQNVFAGEQPFFDFHGEAALEEDRAAGFGGGDEELEILGVASADLQNVGVFGDHFGVIFGKELRDDGKAGALAGFGEKF